MGSHRDVDEQDLSAPVVSVSLGDDAVFHIGGLRRQRSETADDLEVRAMWSFSAGEARLAYHGVDRVLAGTSDLLPEGGRINLTLRRVTEAAAPQVTALWRSVPRRRAVAARPLPCRIIVGGILALRR